MMGKFLWFTNEHSYEQIFNIVYIRKIKDDSRKIVELDKDNNVVNVRRSASEASKELNINIYNLCAILRNNTERHTIAGKRFAYYNGLAYLKNCYIAKPESGKSKEFVCNGEIYNSIKEFEFKNNLNKGYGNFLYRKYKNNELSEMKNKKAKLQSFKNNDYDFYTQEIVDPEKHNTGILYVKRRMKNVDLEKRDD